MYPVNGSSQQPVVMAQHEDPQDAGSDEGFTNLSAETPASYDQLAVSAWWGQEARSGPLRTHRDRGAFQHLCKVGTSACVTAAYAQTDPMRYVKELRRTIAEADVYLAKSNRHHWDESRRDKTEQIRDAARVRLSAFHQERLTQALARPDVDPVAAHKEHAIALLRDFGGKPLDGRPSIHVIQDAHGPRYFFRMTFRPSGIVDMEAVANACGDRIRSVVLREIARWAGWEAAPFCSHCTLPDRGIGTLTRIETGDLARLSDLLSLTTPGIQHPNAEFDLSQPPAKSFAECFSPGLARAMQKVDVVALSAWMELERRSALDDFKSSLCLDQKEADELLPSERLQDLRVQLKQLQRRADQWLGSTPSPITAPESDPSDAGSVRAPMGPAAHREELRLKDRARLFRIEDQAILDFRRHIAFKQGIVLPPSPQTWPQVHRSACQDAFVHDCMQDYVETPPVRQKVAPMGDTELRELHAQVAPESSTKRGGDSQLAAFCARALRLSEMDRKSPGSAIESALALMADIGRLMAQVHNASVAVTAQQDTLERVRRLEALAGHARAYCWEFPGAPSDSPIQKDRPGAGS